MSESHTPEPAPASQEQIREIQKHILGYWKIFAVQVAFAIAMVIVWTVVNGAAPGMRDKLADEEANCTASGTVNARGRRKSRTA